MIGNGGRMAPTIVSDYALAARQVEAILPGESDFLANAANFASFVFHELPGINWAGFYFAGAQGDLVLGPFNVLPACTRLPRGRGVCGASFSSCEAVVVDDVSAFGDHIVCDGASKSEIAIPLLRDERAYGVFDIDSPSIARFSVEDRIGIENLVRVFLRATAVSPRSRFLLEAQ